MQSFADVLKNFACFTVHRETPVLESLLMNLQALGPVTLFKKKTPIKVLFCEIRKVFTPSFTEHLQ